MTPCFASVATVSIRLARTPRALRLLPVLAAATLAACASMVQAPQVEPLTTAQLPLPAAAPPQPTAGAIYAAGGHRPLFEDRRARLVGDTLTIQIEEQVSASQQSTSKVDKSGSVAMTTSALPFASTRFLGRLEADANAKLAGSADGRTDSTNTFTGSITVLVTEVLPNGNLVVAGDKQIGVNQNVDVLRFSGVVNPAQIRAGNTISSTQVAMARVQQRGRGDVARVQAQGWLGRFFGSVAPL